MLTFHLILTLVLVGILFFDLTKYLIPNWMVGIVLALWPVMLLMQPLPEDYSIWMALAVGVGMFVLGIGIFAMKWMGGGDVKLMAALAFWLGVEAILQFLVLMGMLGGAMAFGLLLTRPLAARMAKGRDPESLPRLFRYGEPIPYGVAITIAFLIVLWMGDVPGLPVEGL